MAKYPTIEEILALNPQIDEQELEKAKEVLCKLRSNKISKHGYTLTPPFARPRVMVGEDDAVDSRTIYLRRR